jgi:hypothetical protein
MKKILLLTALLATMCSFAGTPKDPYRMILITNINSCSMCNHTTASIVSNNPLFNNIEYLMSAEDATAEQAKEFLEEMMQRPCKVTINTKLYDRIAETITIFKFPHLVILDTANKILFKTPIDSIVHYYDVIETYTNKKYKTKTFSNDRIRKVIGWRTLNKVGNYFVVTGWQNSEKVYVLNKENKALDSIYLTTNDDVIHRLIQSGNGKDINMEDMKVVYKKYDMPYSLIQFGTGALSGKDQISSSIDLQYVDPNGRFDTIESTWLVYGYTYKPATKKLRILPIVDWASDSANSYVFDHYKFDYQSYQEIDDSTWLMGGKEDIQEEYDLNNNPRRNDTILLFNRLPKKNYQLDRVFFYFRKAHDDTKLRYANKYIKVSFDSIASFEGDKMNEPGYMWTYQLQYPYFYYNNAPLIYNDLDKSIFDIKKISKNITWIHAMDVDKNVLRILVQEKKNRVLYVVWRNSMKVMKRYNFGELPSRNNIVLEGENIYYMNKEGQIIEMTK